MKKRNEIGRKEGKNIFLIAFRIKTFIITSKAYRSHFVCGAS